MKLALSILALIYFLWPYDILPDLVIGWGWMDDLAILYLLWRFFYRGKGRVFTQSQGSSRSDENADRNDPSSTSVNQPKDPYEVLQISRDASQEKIKAAYKELAGKYHPDKVLHLGEEFQSLAEDRFKEIQEAYQKLTVKGGKDSF